MFIKNVLLVSDSRHTLNAVISVDVRNLIHLEDGLIQPSSVQFELTKEGALELIEALQLAIELEGDHLNPDYLIQKGRINVEGTYYNSAQDYQEGTVSQDWD